MLQTEPIKLILYKVHHPKVKFECFNKCERSKLAREVIKSKLAGFKAKTCSRFKIGPIKRQLHKMVKHTQTIRRGIADVCLTTVGLTLKGIISHVVILRFLVLALLINKTNFNY